ncbi:MULTISPECIES: threonine-phosphate decarboxylase CobD [unclassified Rhizobium]|uniref:threonine-phosphate decarboxylase CobD n=1 Tax=unclassified Rhizobium TaxID=2613769 RepID=UPI0006FEE260|nr:MULTISPECIES: threonine-phosphate decarboxylase CobD [unclassified Rhizobium]KQV34670.1 threonine-phosphate decarboxylase [Rhizobium sp. Root1212]KRD24004.1 threonine-phosphate decarboxylase [Rhizobium sp. Root268]
MSPAPIVHGGGITEAALQFGGAPSDWLDLSTGINPNPVILPDIPQSAWHRLPDRHRFDAASEAARGYYGSGAIPPLAVPGTQSVIQLLPRLLAPGRRVAILGPTYGEYGRVLRAAGFAVDEIADLDAVSAEHALLIVVNPNNPTGRVVAPDVLEALAKRFAVQDGFLLVDEAFGDTSPEASVASLVERHERLIVFRSFGKFFGLAGLRLGFVIASENIRSSFREWLGPWAVSGPALVIAAGLMGQDTSPISTAIMKRKQALDGVLQNARLALLGGTPLFTLVKHPEAVALQTALCRRHVLTRRFDYAPTWLRIGLASDEAADAHFAGALTQALREIAA